MPQGKISSEQSRNVEKMKLFGHSRAPKKLKKRPHFDHFPRPWEIDPYMLYPAKYDLNVINI